MQLFYILWHFSYHYSPKGQNNHHKSVLYSQSSEAIHSPTKFNEGIPLWSELLNLFNWPGRNIALSRTECDLRTRGNTVWFWDLFLHFWCTKALHSLMNDHWGRILIRELLEKRGCVKSYVPVGLKSSRVIGLQSSDYVKDSCTGIVEILQWCETLSQSQVCGLWENLYVWLIMVAQGLLARSCNYRLWLMKSRGTLRGCLGLSLMLNQWSLASPLDITLLLHFKFLFKCHLQIMCEQALSNNTGKSVLGILRHEKL